MLLDGKEFKELNHIFQNHFIIKFSEFIAHTYITFPLNLGLPYDKILFTLECSGVGFCIKWIAYKLHFHQNSLRDQMVNCELYIIHGVI